MNIRSLFFAAALLLPAGVYADTITLQDGTRLEGRIDGEMDGVALVRTQYGALNIEKNKIVSIEKAEEPPAAAPEAPAVPAGTETAVSTGTEAAGSAPPAEIPAAPAAPPEYTFKTVILSTMAYEKIYYENGEPLATELFDSKGNLMGLRGAVKDATYKEYYADGKLKTEKTMINSKLSGTLKAYYPNGLLQSEAFYFGGRLNGSVRVYSENGKPLLEQNFLAGVPDGWFREFDGAGKLKSELFYKDGHIAEKPAPAAPEKKEPSESGMTAESRRLARGERVTFRFNGKYVGRVQLDDELNLISRRGKVPDGSVKLYDKTGALEMEFVFEDRDLVSLKTYGADGGLTGEFRYEKGKAVKKQAADRK